MSALPEAEPRRSAYMVLSPQAMPYARLALTSLFAHAVEPLHLCLITDSADDKHALQNVLADIGSRLSARSSQSSSVCCEQELADAEADRFRDLPNLRLLRHGHPCWRKITDPLLLSRPGDEILLLDPDLYFPNPFTFEATPPNGVLLMWQQPNCLLPPEVVQRALDARVPLARHVDIGVSHWRGGIDLDWLDWLVGALGGVSLPRIMHVEAILWAAIAMHIGGGYLDPSRWVCWRRTQAKRVRVKLGGQGAELLRSEPWGRMKCFHAGGEAKWWLPAALAHQEPASHPQTAASPLRPFVPLTATRYACEQGAKGLLRQLGYYRVFNPRAS